MNTLTPSRKPAAVRRAGGCLFLLAGFNLNYGHRTMRAVFCALWVLTTASSACCCRQHELGCPGIRAITASPTTLPASAPMARSSLASGGFQPPMRRGHPQQLPFAGPPALARSALATCRRDNDQPSPAGVSGDGRTGRRRRQAATALPATTNQSAAASLDRRRRVLLALATCWAAPSAPATGGQRPIARSSSGIKLLHLRRASLPLDRRLRHGRPGRLLPGGPRIAPRTGPAPMARSLSEPGKFCRLRSQALPLDRRLRHGRPGLPAGRQFQQRQRRVSGDGSVIVGTSFSGRLHQVARWTAGSGMVGLGYPPGGQQLEQRQSLASGDGSVVA